MECDPGQRQPACPVVAAKHEDSSDDCQQTDSTDPGNFRTERKLPFEVDQMKHQPDNTNDDIDQADDSYSKRTLRPGPGSIPVHDEACDALRGAMFWFRRK